MTEEENSAKAEYKSEYVYVLKEIHTNDESNKHVLLEGVEEIEHCFALAPFLQERDIRWAGIIGDTVSRQYNQGIRGDSQVSIDVLKIDK